MGTGHGSALRFLRQLGPKGNPKSMDEVRKTTNPNYRKGPEWRTNCQRCVFAYEMQRRGYDVEAKPLVMDGSDPLMHGGWKKVMDGMKLERLDSSALTHMAGKVNAICNKMSEWGEGSRAVVYMHWKGRNSAHVIIAEQFQGNTTFIDPQVGKYVDLASWGSLMVQKDLQIARIDNLNPTSLITECAQPRSR